MINVNNTKMLQIEPCVPTLKDFNNLLVSPYFFIHILSTP